MSSVNDKNKLTVKRTERGYGAMVWRHIPKGFLLPWRTRKTVEAAQGAEQLQDVIEGDELQDVAAGDELQDVAGAGTSTTLGSYLSAVMDCIGAVFYRVEQAAVDLVNQSDPGVAVDVLPDWERNLGLPSSCSTSTLLLEERQNIAHSRLWGKYNTTTNADWVALGTSLGFVVSVDASSALYTPRQMGLAVMGLEGMGGALNYNTLRVTYTNPSNLDVSILFCEFTRRKQAHTLIVFVEG